MAQIFPIDFEEKLTMAQDDYILFSDSEDGNKIKKAQYKNLKGEKGDKWDQWPQGIQGIQWPQGEQGIQWPQWEQWEQGIQWETWPQGETGETWNWIASITSSKNWKITTVTITETDGNVDTFQISDGADWEWAWDVLWPNSSTNNHVALFNWATWKIIKDWGALPSVINSLDSTSTTDSLSAAQWKALKDAIDNISWLWKFLSLWNSATWQPISFPLATPYTYTTWDWFMVETVWTTNYKPNWSSYTWAASTTVETETVEQWDVYIYDWTTWLLQKNTAVEVSFSAIAWQPTDNTALANALNAKQNTLTTQTAYTSKGSATKVPQISTNTLWQVTSITEVTITQPTKTSDLTNDSGYITSSAIPTDYVKTSWNQTIDWTKTFSTSPVVPSKTTAATNTWTAIATEAQVYKKQDTISDLAIIRSWASAGATALQPNANISSLTNDSGYLTSSTWVTTVNGNHWAVTVQGTISDLSTIRTNATNWATVVSGDSWITYTIKKSTTAPSGAGSNTITLVVE